LKEISVAGKKYSAEIKAALGDKVVPGTSTEVFEAYKTSMDVDTARMLLFRAARWVVAEVMNKNDDDCGDMVGLGPAFSVEVLPAFQASYLSSQRHSLRAIS